MLLRLRTQLRDHPLWICAISFALSYASTIAFYMLSHNSMAAGLMMFAVIVCSWYYQHRGAILSTLTVAASLPLLFRLAGLSVLPLDNLPVLFGVLLIFSVGLIVAYSRVTRDLLTAELTKSMRMQEQLKTLVDYDPLTNLLSRSAILAAIKNAMKRAATGRSNHFAILFVDVDKMKLFNDTLGHETADRLLQALGRRLQQQLGLFDLVGRIGGDEFVVLIDQVSNASQVQSLAQGILEALHGPIQIDDQSMHLSVSIGICRYGQMYENASQMLTDADMAMYQVKKRGGNGFAFFEESFRGEAVERFRAIANLHGAIQQDRLMLYYQPICDLQSKHIAGFECLLRLRGEDGEIFSAGEFLEMIEDTSLMKEIDLWVIKQFGMEYMRWAKELGQGTGGLFFTINFSSPSLIDERIVRELTDQFSRKPIRLEITENALIRDWAGSQVAVNNLGQQGIRLMLDDFGSGYSSLSYLRNIPFDCIKISGDFLSSSMVSNEAHQLYEGMLLLAKRIDKPVIAEGIEGEDQLQLLTEMGVDYGQGFYLARPMPMEKALNLILDNGGDCPLPLKV